jgi:nitrite reductase/ring-hydroxylating ferredoxin subunit
VKRHRVASLTDIPEGGHLLVRLGSLEVGLFRVGDQLRAWRNVCPHQAAPVCRGTIAGTNLPSGVYEYQHGREGEILQCPWHGWEFDLLTGEHLVEQSRSRLRGYPVEVDGDDVYLCTRT